MSVKIKRAFLQDQERYEFDWSICSYRKGWAQLIGEQDFAYYGQWANPFKKKIICLAEGDLTITNTSTEKEFIEQIRSIAKWERENNSNPDYFCIQPAEDHLQKWKELGLSDLLR